MCKRQARTVQQLCYCYNMEALRLFIHNNENHKVFGLILLSKLVIFFIIFLSFTFLRFNTLNYQHSTQAYPDKKVTLHTAYSTWDAQFYLLLGDKGYNPSQHANAFYPLYPELIQLVNFVTKSSFWSGFIIANFASLVGCYLFYLLAKKYLMTQAKARGALLYLLLFPTSFFLSLIYTEGLFLALAAGFFYALHQRKWLVASFFALLLPITRPVGIFIIVPAIVAYLEDNLKGKSMRLQANIYPLNRTLLPVITPLFGIALYFIFMQLTTGNFLEGVYEASTFISSWHVSNIFNPFLFLSTLFTPHLAIHGFLNSAIDRVFFLFFIALPPYVYKKVSHVLFSYYLCTGGVAFFGSFMSYTRYLLLAFPLFIVLPFLFEKGWLAKLKLPFMIGCLIVQVIFIAMYALNYWVA